MHAITPSRVATPETYVGTERALGWTNGPQKGRHDYGRPPSGLGLNQFAYGGIWNETKESGTALGSSSLNLDFQARRVYVVLGPPRGRPGLVQVLLDGKPIPANAAGDDVHGGVVTVDRQRLYNVVDLSKAGGGYLSLHEWRRDEWTPAVKAAGLAHRTPYALRHTFATFAIQASVPLFHLARFMGTSVEQIDLTYGHLLPDVARPSEGEIRCVPCTR